jgi:hypothetical protein
MKNMIRDWSVDETTENKWQDDIAFTGDSYEFAFHFLANNKPIKAIANSDDFLVFKDKNSSFSISKLFTNINQAKIRDFDNVVSSFQKVKKVSLNRTKWTSSRCSCAYYLKNYFCYHIVAVAVQERLTEIPLKYQTQEIAAKKKRGRPPKATPALEMCKSSEPPKKKRKLSASKIKSKKTILKSMKKL